ncbi:MAG: hypothetical protein RBS76_03170 [Acholeplasmatales bacterium]|jgi:hypothetical protein|nr:hypothetical protein [Acholeplasmataceae bacterium]MDY0115484.1 hypothetical protein [Acholeplasmatales bacterium]MCK9234094.1 hypothetical protein [Acholeplasmataceae bacterium]MCK9288978.1 hypothetical protein [Acholeplasmataceae bacterium]MCK9427572.1 hypothetical protein [Acholeplasmataceae bacterium]
MDGNLIYDPLKSYQNIFREKHHTNTTAFFDELVKKSEINIAENKQVVAEIDKLNNKINNLENELSKRRGFKTFLIVVVVIAFFISIINIYSIVNIHNSAGRASLIHYVLLPISLIIGIGLIVLTIKKINPVIKTLVKDKAELKEKLNKKLSIAYQGLKPLHDLFYEGISEELFSKTLPIFNMDPMFDSKRLDYLVNKFGLYDAIDENRSTLYVKSGDINGNPFYIANDLVHTLGTKKYTGTLTITYTNYVYRGGKRVAQRQTQVLSATIEKPCPYYNEESYLIYGNEAAPDLIFSRVDSDAEHMTQKQIDRLVRRDYKTLTKKTQKSVRKGGTYTALAHEEFEVLFGAIDRNNEVQFRLLFTPLAQKQLLELMKDKEIGYGDNFDFVKYKMINGIFPEHLKGFELDGNPKLFLHYDYEKVKNLFISYNNLYFKNIYFAFAPLLSIPLYQQQKPREYIYKDSYESYVSFYEHEKVCNKINIEEFKHPLSTTRNILKTTTVKSGNEIDTIKVTAYGYQTENKVDYIPTLGGDGRTHLVPVHWVEYTPVMQETDVNINVIKDKKEETYRDKIASRIERLKTRENLSEKDLYLFGRFLAHVIKK